MTLKRQWCMRLHAEVADKQFHVARFPRQIISREDDKIDLQ